MNLPMKAISNVSPAQSGSADKNTTMALPASLGVSSSPLVIDPSAVAEMLFNTMVIYGPTGTRKTTQIGEFAKYIYERTGKITRLISFDGGGWGPVQDLINAGIIDAWRMVEEPRPKLALTKASKGAWPKVLQNGLRQGVVLEPRFDQRKEFLKDVGAYAIESWSSISRAIMRDAVSKGQKISEEIVGKFTEEDTDFGSGESYGAPSRAHYGFTQNYILDMIRNLSALPVERVLYSSLEGKGEDKLSKALQYGPEVSGQAITAAIPTYVGDCLHFEDFIEDAGNDPMNPKQKLVEPGVRVWFTQHPDPQTQAMWPAKPRIVGSKFEEFRERMGRNGYFILSKDRHLGSYLALQDELLSKSSEAAREWKKKIDEKRNS